MKTIKTLKTTSLVITALTAFSLATPQFASAHCDTLDGPVIQDAHKAITAKDIVPILKWVKPKDEKAVKAAFNKAIAAKGENAEAAHKQFFSILVKIHRTGEGAPFTGLKPAGTVEPAVAEADKALASGSAEALVKMINSDIESGIRKRFEHAADAYKHKDESVAQGREFVEAYVEFTHYVEKLHLGATGKDSPHGEHKKEGKHGHDAHGTEKH